MSYFLSTSLGSLGAFFCIDTPCQIDYNERWKVLSRARLERTVAAQTTLSPRGFSMEVTARRIVVKLGTSTLTHPSGLLNIRRISALCQVLSDLKNAGNEMILVSSGAIAMGVGKLALPRRPEDIPAKQAAAAVGQCELMYTYDKYFSEHSHVVAQLLLTGADLEHPGRFCNFQNTIRRLLALGALPIINENDTIATEEIEIGDNDTLAAIVAQSVSADLLILLSDIDGLYTEDPHENPHAALIRNIYELSDDILTAAGGAGSAFGTGGMETKLQAARICMRADCDMVIANGAQPHLLYDIVEGKSVGSKFWGNGNRRGSQEREASL